MNSLTKMNGVNNFKVISDVKTASVKNCAMRAERNGPLS